MKPFLTFLFLSILLSSCIKDDPTEPIFIMGVVNDAVEYTAIDTTLIQTVPGEAYTRLDVNNDSIFDLEFIVLYDSTEEGRHVIRSMAATLHDSIRIAVMNINDSIWDCLDLEDSIPAITSHNKYADYTCSGNDSLVEIFTDIFTIAGQDEYMPGKPVTYRKGAFDLAYHDQSSLKTHKFHYNNEIVRGNWIGKGLRNMVFRMILKGKVRFGWIRLNVEDYTHMYIEGFAVQK